ncbi:RNA polymerase sigma factor SigJ [Dactylosporangium sucinum]|nr:RNA polymerase sigma factor SigJ [Dactylosporangium sucinum]
MTIMDERPQLLGLAYRLLGSLADAEDVVQEAFARWYGLSPAQRESIESPGAWLSTVTSRICLDLLGSARARRERYVGEWIPEPVPPGADLFAGDPADRVTLDESVSMAFLVVLESMTPAERVAFVLHDVFRYPFADVAAIVGRTPAACRQLASSARRRLGAARPPAPAARRSGIVRDFKAAWEAQDIDALVELLDPDVTAVADGGGRAQAELHPVHGAAGVAAGFVAVRRKAPDLRIVERTVNGQPGLVMLDGDVTVTVLAFDVTDGRITHLWAIRNPDKLRPWTTGGR